MPDDEQAHPTLDYRLPDTSQGRPGKPHPAIAAIGCFFLGFVSLWFWLRFVAALLEGDSSWAIRFFGVAAAFGYALWLWVRRISDEH
ncbi:MAG TPA: hypothetical protein VH475_10085 [Tepidisphaeraceae bacterium]|jgi:hypothetical protein